MKILKYIFALIIAVAFNIQSESLFSLQAFAQDYDVFYVDEDLIETEVKGAVNSSTYGLYFTPKGTVKTLVIFAGFISTDEDYELQSVPDWPYDKINISKLNKGIYFISFYQENKLINTQKIIKS